MAKTRETAFSFGQWENIKGVLQSMRERALTHLRHGMTGKELFDAFVREDDKESLQHVFKLCDVQVSHQSFQYNLKIKDLEIEKLTASVDAAFSITLGDHAKFKFLFPKYMAKAKLHAANPKLEEVFSLVASINFEWARVYQVLKALHEQCQTPSQVKTVCPHLGAMLADYENTRELGVRLMSMNDSKTLPALPLGLRQHALYVGQTITKGLLVPKVSELEPDEFNVHLTAASCKAERWDGKPWSVLENNF